jgi:hypothetical protein
VESPLEIKCGKFVSQISNTRRLFEKVNSPDYSSSVIHPPEWMPVVLVDGARTKTTLNPTWSFVSIAPETN